MGLYSLCTMVVPTMAIVYSPTRSYLARTTYSRCAEGDRIPRREGKGGLLLLHLHKFDFQALLATCYSLPATGYWLPLLLATRCSPLAARRSPAVCY